MKKIKIVKSNKEFNDIINKRNSISNSCFIINRITNDDNIPKFGITISKKLANAVNRNKIKRQIKSIIDNNKNIYQYNQKYIIIIKKGALDKSYQELEKELISLFNKEEKDEKTAKQAK